MSEWEPIEGLDAFLAWAEEYYLSLYRGTPGFPGMVVLTNPGSDSEWVRTMLDPQPKETGDE